MPHEGSSPDYSRLFGELRFPEKDDARTVWSPAAYFVELLGLLEGTFDRVELLERRPDLKQVVLDSENTFTETAYLDIVNEVLERLAGSAPYETLERATHPFGLPFTLRSERLRVCLEQLKVTPEELYRLFATHVDHDVAAREYLGLTPETTAVVTGSSTDPAVLGERYGLAAGETLAVLLDAGRFTEATGLDHPRMRELLGLAGQGGPVTLNEDETTLVPPDGGAELPPGWLDRAHRLIRLERATGLSLTDLDLVLTSCAQGRLDGTALRAVAAVLRLGKVHGVEVGQVCELIVPWRPEKGVTVEECAGDILTHANRDYRFRLAALIGVAEPDVVEIVRRYREHYAKSEPSPFDRGRVTLAEISLLRRVGLLASALGIGTGELFDVLVALEGDPALQRYSTFAVLGEVGSEIRDLHRVLEGGAPEPALWLAQTLFAVVGWMGTAGFEGAELAEILGGRPDPGPSDLVALFDRLSGELDAVALTPQALVSNRFGIRAARVVHDVLVAFDDGVVAAVGSRLLAVDRVKAEAAAHRAVTDLGVIFPSDFTGLGLGDRLQGKIFRNLVYRAGLRADGTLAATPGELDLAGDFESHREMLFKAVAATVNGVAAFYPSDLTDFGDIGTELYDNLMFNGYLDEEGELLDPGFFLDPDNAAKFVVNVDLAEAVKPVADLVQERLDRFRTEALTLDPAVLAGLRLTDAQLNRLLASLRFNGHLDAEDRYTDQAALLGLAPDDFGLAAEFAVLRKAVLAALRSQIAAFHAELTTFTAEDFLHLADDLAAKRAFRALDGVDLADGRVVDPAVFADPEGTVDLGSDFSAADEELVFEHIARMLRDEAPYRLDPAALTRLGLTDEQRAALLGHLVTEGKITERYAVPPAWLGYFANADNSLDFALPGMVDYARDVFFLLHAVAKDLTAAVTEITDRLVALADRQDRTLYACLADVLGLDQATARALCGCVAGGEREARTLLAAPALDLPKLPDDPRLRLAHRRIRRFALLAAKLGLDAVEVSVIFADQDLVGKYPEPLTLPPGVNRIQALLDAGDGTILLFGDDGGYWTYDAVTRALTSPARHPLSDLSPHLAVLSTVDAAFTRPDGVAWLAGRDVGGAALVFTRERGGTRWARKTQTWGKIKNAFADPARIDGAFTDNDGRTYLFAGDQYVRYSAGFDAVDEGYPRDVAEWRSHEGLPVPGANEAVDACFQDPDGVVHLFSGDRWITVNGERPAAEVWGRTGSASAGATSIDAAYAVPSAVHLIAGGEVLRYSDSLENPGVHADEGVSRRLQGVPPQFEGGVEAAFTDPSGVVHLFKDGKTVALDGTSATIAATAERWGVLTPALPGNRVDAAFAGLDGRTYLFSGDTYLRYSTADYSAADPGFPRTIAGDWGGLTRVDASFVMDGRTYLFGEGGLLFEVPVVHQADLDAGRLTPALRILFQEHGLTLTGVRGSAPRWDLATGEGVAITVVREGLRLKARGDGSRFYVRYSTRDYRTPDQGFPKPLADNWWNMPDDLRLDPVDAVFTGRDQRTYLFAGSRFVRFDARHRWWSEPMEIREKWDSIPFDRIDAAFVGVDGRTYLFSGDRYVRYSADDYTEIDDRYPAAVSGLWGHVTNNLARSGRVDAAFVLDVVEKVDGVDVTRTRTYLFSGDQYVRYTGTDLTVVDPGYPRRISALSAEPGLAALPVPLDGVEAAFADRRTAYLFRGGVCHAVSTTSYRRYDDLPLGDVRCAYLEDGSIVAETGEGWRRLSALEGRAVTAVPFRPRTLRTVPARFASGLSSVLTGADGTTYLFTGSTCFNTQLGHDYPIEQEWGRPRDVLRETGAVDAAFVGRDGKTYLFSGDQFVVYAAGASVVEGDPQPIAAHWGGLESVALAYVHRDRTHLYGKPGPDGLVRHVVYSGTSYTAPDAGYPVTTPAVFPGAPEGFALPDAVLVEGTTLVLLAGKQCVSYDDRAGRWSVVRPIERLYPGFGHDLVAPDKLRSALRASDGATWFFFGDTCAAFRDDAFGPRAPVREHWGLSPNPFLAPGGTVDAAFVWRGQYTYLFSGDRYVRYTGPVYRNIDPGYPKPVAGNLRKEEPFTLLPEAFEDALDRPIDAIVGNDRTIHVIVGGVCHTVSTAQAASFEHGSLGRTRNTFAETGRVDAALVADRKIYLFSGDQYVRYSGSDRTRVDDGYPRALADLAAELGLPPLPPDFQDGLDAAFRGPDGVIRLFKGRQCLSGGTVEPVSGRWGTVRNAFDSGRLGAAFTAPSGELYAFSGDQYVRYPADGLLDHIEPGYPRTFQHDFGDTPADFHDGPDGAFVLDGRTYLLKGDRYLRYSGPYHVVDRTFPQDFRHRWAGTADYRLSDVHTIVRFAELCRSHPDGLAAFFLDGADDPYTYLAETLGQPIDEVRWARRNMGLLRAGTHEEQLFEIEFLLTLTDLFAAADRIGTGPSELYDVWAKVFGPAPDLEAAAGTLHAVLQRRTAPLEFKARSAQIRDRLNVLRRDALLAWLTPRHGDSRELYEQYLIDVDMGHEGKTSRVREAIAATQLYLQRYLLGLETVALPGGADPEAVRLRLRTWWSWMRSYRTWEANRKVFLYPENYLRPELRTRKTPAFSTLQDDLLQGDITAEAVQAAYKRYLDEYTEVSRLAIAGGYVYRPEEAGPEVRRLVLFGRTRTEPRRYYHRTAEFRDGGKLSATWDPWLKVDVQIAADRVHPVHAFGRVFVFWPAVEPAPAGDPSTTTVVVTEGSSGHQQVNAPPPRFQVKIYYSFRNLNGEWVAAQVLASDVEREGMITDVGLYVQASRKVPGVSEHDAIVVQCSYTYGDNPVKSAFTLTPEMYALPAGTTVAPARPTDLDRLFDEPPATAITEEQVVRFNAPADSQDGRWFSVDHKGGSFLCRPVAAPDDPAPLLPFKGNDHRLPTTWDRVDAGFRLTDGTLYFFEAARGTYIAVPPDRVTSQQTRKPVADRFGVVGTALLRDGVVDSGVIRGGKVYLFAGDEYYRHPARPFGTLDPGYPKKLADNPDDLPKGWSKIDVAFTMPGGAEVLYSRARNSFVVTGSGKGLQSASSAWGVPSTGVDRVHRRGDEVFLVYGDRYVRLKNDLTVEPRSYALAGNADQVPVQAGPGPVLQDGSLVISFDNDRASYTLKDGGTTTSGSTRELGRVPTGFGRTGEVDAAYVAGGRLFLVGPDEYVRYTLVDGGETIPEYVDEGYPKKTAQRIQGVLTRGERRYAVGSAGYAPLAKDWEPGTPVTFLSYQGNWRGLPDGFPGDFTGLLDGGTALYLFLGPNYAAYPLDDTVPRPYEIAALPTELVRLTSSTASELNRRLLAGGVDALLDPVGQELDELPAFSTAASDAKTVRVKQELAEHVPVSSHLDFDSANGLYHWEIFFHAPLLIAQALNGAQRFEEARHWYEYVFDPTRPARYWRFLPFLAVDVAALVAECRQDLAALGSSVVESRLSPILTELDALAPAFRRAHDLTAEQLTYLADLAGSGLDAVRAALAALPRGPVADGLGERVAMIGGLRRQYNLMGDREALVQAYLDDPYDPHAIAQLRPEAYRRAVVMAYIDNLLDWGDMLFRQYTAETVDEARMLYIYAYDLLGSRPVTLGPAALPPAAPYSRDLGDGPGETGHLTADGALLEEAGAVHAGVAHPYFYVPGNEQFLEYWNRVEDRLTKIRQSLDIMGVSRPIPLFDPPLDVMALVRGAAGGLTADQVVAAAAAPVPAYRFEFTHQRARELADRLQQLGNSLLDAIDRRDNEELTLLQNRQEGEILALTKQIKETQVTMAEESLAEARDAKAAAEDRVAYYQKLIDEGMSPLQQARLAMLAIGAVAQFVAGGLKIGAAIASGVPQALVGPFIMGTEVGGEQVGKALEVGADVSSSFGEGFSQLAEVLGVRADHEQQEQDWKFQRDTSRSDVVQLGHQLTGAELQLAVARRELEIHNREIAHLTAVTDFLTAKFAGPELYGWMVGQVSGLYFQTYRLAHDMARAAERAFEAERGTAPGLIRATYWDSRRKGLLAGDQLAFDLDRLGQAYFDAGGRGLEITKRVSLLQLDATALLALTSGGRCEFALTETLFDRDFPGHYRRRIKTVSVAFVTADGPVTANATLTQIDNKTVLSPDPKAVRFLLDPKGSPPESMRGDWRPGQRVALSEVDDGREDSGLFELRYDDERYLPFEGTGAVSRWRLETRKPPAGLLDVVITVRYTAEDGGETFATAVRGMLKPYPSALFLDVAARFPDAWDDFTAGGGAELQLPITPDLFPAMSGRQVTGVVAQYGAAGGSARFLLHGDPRLALAPGKLVQTPGLVAGTRAWRLTVTGDPAALDGFSLILLYRATP
ncbi:hemopexin repeat-containing protein [Rhizohabitans arisaemae]|uniref:Tc toxin subunit A-related protein n=1 Tax=Rhizohabitans arisaemae TaxID=2720610 RepID=UPI0024B0B657|nr:hemopexin repeat-containing protein [Rhizohabitans arisaemae]